MHDVLLSSPGWSRRKVAAALACVALAVTTLTIAAAPARAADATFQVANASELFSAVSLCEGVSLEVGDTCTIEITESFVMDDGFGVPTYTGVADVYIVGGDGIEVSFDEDGHMRFFAFTPNEPTATLTVEGLSVLNFGSEIISSGGAILATDGNLVIDSSLFAGNESGSSGGAVAVVNGDLVINDSTFEFNTAASRGGAAFVIGADRDLTITNSLFRNNYAVDSGGAVVNWEALTTIENSTFSGNSVAVAGRGGAVDAVLSTSRVVMTHVTFVRNTADNGAHVSTGSIHANALVSRATVFADGIGAGGDCFLVATGAEAVSAGFNWSEDDSCWETQADGDTEFGDDARLGSLIPGGNAQVVGLDPGSPLFNAIPVADCVLATDQRGTSRPQGTGCDIGAFEYGPGPFPDVSINHPFVLEIEWLAGSGITSGYDDGDFRPGANVSRQAMAAFLYRYSGASYEHEGPASFADVPLSHPFYDEIEWLAVSGITSGYDDGDFRPGASVTRQAMAAFMYRLLRIEDYEPPTSASFPDVPADHPFFDEIEWLVSVAVTTGYNDGSFRPGANVTRQAMAAFLARLNELPQ